MYKTLKGSYSAKRKYTLNHVLNIHLNTFPTIEFEGTLLKE
jgi:hypothetical protein